MSMRYDTKESREYIENDRMSSIDKMLITCCVVKRRSVAIEVG